MFSVYWITSIEGYHYVGSTANLEKRLAQHNSGISKWTRRGTNWRLLYVESFTTRREAIIRETWLKSGAGREFLKTVKRLT